MYALAEHYKDKKVLITYPIGSLNTQIPKEFLSYGADKNEMALINNKALSFETRIQMMTWKTIDNIENQKWFDKFDVLLVDECHRFSTDKTIRMLSRFRNAEYRYGLTGTHKKDIISRQKLKGIFGPPHVFTTNKEMMDKGVSSKLMINIIVLEYTDIERHDLMKKVENKAPLEKYKIEIEDIKKIEKRNKFVANLALSLKGNTVLLFRGLNHGDEIFKYIESKVDKDVKTYYIDGSIEYELRDIYREEIDANKKTITSAAIQAFGTGTNIKNINDLILAHPILSSETLIQSIGRALRTSETKKTSTLFDIADDFSIEIEGYSNFGMKHLKERIKIYNKEKFEYKIYKVKI